jgi:micrococcal nuclease
MELYWYRGSVVKIIDGDTLDIDIDLGFDIWHSIRVRLNGLNAPETRTSSVEEKEAGLRSKEFVKTWLDNRGYKVLLHTIKDGTEKYGRILAEVYDSTGYDNLNNDLIKEGFAVPYNGGHK